MTETGWSERLDSIVRWGYSDANVVALVLTGSRARADGWADDLSDLDVEVVAIDVGALAEDDGWIHALSNVMVHLALANEPGPATRLVFYEGGDKVDFTLCGRSRLHAMTASGRLNDLYERGYRVLLDKEGLTGGLPAAGGRPSRRLPDQVDLDAIVTEFFFEAAHIPRYLMRDELWLVKARDWTMKKCLVTVLEWHALAKSRGGADVWHMGTHMASWVDAHTWRDLQQTYARMDREDSWRALLATIGLFRRIARETAVHSRLRYPDDVDARVTEYVMTFGSRLETSGGRRPTGISKERDCR
jgi:aminoglycoside 6-adenylyltransferase